jgi:hypothetical protein
LVFTRVVEKLKVPGNKEPKVRIAFDVFMVEDGIHYPARILEELIHAVAVHVLGGAIESLHAFPVWIRVLRAPVFSIGREDAGVCNGGEASVIASGLKHHHIDVGRNLAQLDMALPRLRVDLPPPSIRTGLKVELLRTAIRNPRVVFAHLHGVRLVCTQTVVCVVVVIRPTPNP